MSLTTSSKVDFYKDPAENMIKNLLWTGGWDSTFRLCQNVVIYKRKVQPIYIVDSDRRSLREEIKAQQTIKVKLNEKFPFAEKLILPTKLFAKRDIQIDEKTSEQYRVLRDKIGLGSQYEWLGAFCKEKNLFNLELGFERDPTSKKNRHLRNFIIEKKESAEKTYYIDPKHKGTNTYELLKYYEWPIWMTTRKEMIPIAKKNGFWDIMHLTWFCHNPINGKPCGRCNPCKDAVYYDFKYRLPTSAKVRYHLRFFSIQEMVLKHPHLHQCARKILK